MADHLRAVEKITRMRNLLAHGIKSASAAPWERASAFVVCVDPDGSAHTFTIEEIRDLSEEIDRVRRSIRFDL
ncbi:hypothetical protein [Ensifer aridi]|uniref:hypothetical protein n=1 Tax=Ensifer aridi TaxID=1708715 RepID=UPI0011250F9C|nr:hypothetical protein [Ensifer aridi]